MTRDASLDEFLGGGDDEAEDEDEKDAADAEDATGGVAGTTDAGDGDMDGDEAGAVETTTGGGDVDGADAPATGTDDDAPAAGTDDEASDEPEWLPPAEVEPARSTYDWSPDGAACAACGATVEARWRDDSGLVCPDCKEW